MIRAIRPNAMAQDDAAMVSGWNLGPNIAYTLLLTPEASACGVMLFDAEMSVLLASGAALVGTAQPCVLVPQSGTVGMVDTDLGWHLLITTTGTESPRTIRIGPAVDLPDEIHPIYGDDALALVRATAGVDDHAHYIDDVIVTCPLGFGAWIGDVASVPVDAPTVLGQVESITWTATPDGTNEHAVVRRHVAIAPEPVVEIIPPTVADDAGTATHLTGTSGNVLANDEPGLVVTAVNGLAGKVGVATDGNNGGSFTINASGAWTFSPNGDFALLSGSETAVTSVTYHASDGTAEAMATLTVTVSHANASPVAVDDTGTTDAATTTSGNVLTNDADADSDTLHVSKVAGSAGNVGVAVAGSGGGIFTLAANGAWMFDPNSEFSSLTGEDTATTSVAYHVSDGEDEDVGALTVTVSAAVSDPYWANTVLLVQPPIDAIDGSTSIVDAKGRALTRYGDTQIDTSLGYPTVFYDGVGDRLVAAASADFNFGTGDFTVEAFLNTTQSTGTYIAAIGINHNAMGYWGLRVRHGGLPKVGFTYSDGAAWRDLISNVSISDGVLHHIAVTRAALVFRIFVDGVLVLTVPSLTSAVGTSSYGLSLGYNQADNLYFAGHQAVARITKGVARYTSAFIPPAFPFPTA